MLLDFSVPEPRSLERVRRVFEALAATLCGRTVTLREEKRHAEHDPNGADLCFSSTWRDGALTFTESVTGAEGNPRDGYGYLVAFTLELGAVKLSASTFSWQPAPDALSINVTTSARDWLRLRETLRRELGVEQDRCLTPLIIVQVAKALASEGELDTALSLARECRARSKSTDYAREDLVAWLAANDVTAGGAAMRVRESPMVLDAWLELERAGDPTLAETFARLCPFDLKRWRAAELPIAPWFAHPAWPLERATADAQWFTVHLHAGHVRTDLLYKASHELTGWEWPNDWTDVTGELVARGEGWSWVVSRLARFRSAASHPTVQVSLQGRRTEGTDLVEWLRWTWIPGADAREWLLIVEGDQPQRRVAFTATGSEAFQAKAREVVQRLTHLRWHAVSPEDSLSPWNPPAQTRFVDADVRLAVREALVATLPADQLARVERMIDEKQQSDVAWLARDGIAAASPFERARSKALSAAAQLIAGEFDEVRRTLTLVDLELVQFAEFV